MLGWLLVLVTERDSGARGAQAHVVDVDVEGEATGEETGARGAAELVRIYEIRQVRLTHVSPARASYVAAGPGWREREQRQR